MTLRFRHLLDGLWGVLRALDERVKELDSEISVIAASEPNAQVLQQLRGVGPMIATALHVEIAEWFPSSEDKQGLLKLLDLAKPKLLEVGRLGKMEAWLSS